MPKNVVRALQLGQNYAEPFSKVTILFSDIVSYTNLSSEMTPSQLVDLLNRWARRGGTYILLYQNGGG